MKERERERVVCFKLLVFIVSCDCVCFVALPQDVVNLSEVSECVFFPIINSCYFGYINKSLISDVTLLTLLHSRMILQYVAKTIIEGTNLITSYLHLPEVLLPPHK